MARTLRRKTRKNDDGGKVMANGETLLAANSTESGIPQIQELQNLMDFQKNKVEAIRSSYSQQNAQLARANSALMMKLSDIEKKISELVQENVTLRSKASIGELNYKRRLSEQLDVLENGISHRVEEIFLMFDSVRAKESLPVTASPGKSGPVRSILRKRRSLGSSQGGNKSTNSIQFVESANQVIGPTGVQQTTTESNIDQEENAARRKRRKSSRRESIFSPNDFEFPSQEPETEPADGREDENNNDRIETPLVDQFNEEEAQQVNEQSIDDSPELNELNAQAEGSFSFTNSIIDYSIPEEIAPSASANTEQLSSSKIEVFRDEPEVVTSSQNGDNSQDHQTFIPLTSQSKAKHSRRAPSARSRNSMVDEVMPATNNGTAACDIEFTRTRRTRGKAIDYKLPSLRAKMRRPTEKFVDATTFTNIQELQVKNARRSYKKNPTRKCTTVTTLKEAVISSDSWHNDADNQRHNKQEDPQSEQENVSNSSSSSTKGPINVTTAKEKTAIKYKPILKDITNKPKATKTRKLLKNAIINDICDNNTGAYDDTTNSLGSGGSSFRLNEEDLSVFDLIGSDKAKPSNKTYRAKSKKLTTKSIKANENV